MPKDYREYLGHMLEECNYIMSATEHMNFEAFNSDETLKRAISRSLEIIGEASKKIPADIKTKWNSIEWKNIAGMRDRLIHDYIGVNYRIVWDVSKNKIPQLRSQISNFLAGS